MKIQLPLENWADLLPLVPRLQLAEIVKQLGDRQFARILQFFLTEVGQIRLDHLCIVAPRGNNPNGGGPIVEVRKEMSTFYEQPDLETNLPEGSMPTNVKDFKLIDLSYFNESVANFLRQFQREQQPGNSLLDNVNLWFSSFLNDNSIMPILAQLMPMVGNINSISINNLHHIGLSQLLTTMLTNARTLEIRYYMETSMFPLCDWLYAQRKDGNPRALHLSGSFLNTTLIEQIKKDFSKATRSVSFFVCVRLTFVGRRNVHWQDICLDNGQTNDRLVVKTIDPPAPPGEDLFHLQLNPAKFVLISRYPVGANQGWIEATEKEIMEWDFDEQNRRIDFDYSLGEQNGDNDNM